MTVLAKKSQKLFFARQTSRGAVLFHIYVFEGIQNHFKHKLNKHGGTALRIGCVQHGIVIALMCQDHGFHRQVGKDRLPFLQDERLPKSARPAISIGKRMNEFKLIMKHAGTDERVRLRISQPVKELLHGFRHILSGCSSMDETIPRIHANALIAERHRLRYQPFHHDAMNFEQIVEVIKLLL